LRKTTPASVVAIRVGANAAFSGFAQWPRRSLESVRQQPLSTPMRIALWLHVLSTLVWVGGMFFAHVALRPAVQSLPPATRLPLIAAAMSRFFRWVAAAVATIVVTGFVMTFALGGFARVGAHVHLMTLLGLVMAAIYVFIVAVPFRALAKAVASESWEAGGAALRAVRRLLAVNLVLGLVTVTVAILGHDVVWQ
jgi:uncharacterized membrane protein